MSIKYLLSGPLHSLPVTLLEGTVLEMHLSLVLRCASQSLQVTSVHNGYLLKYASGFPGGLDGKESACNAEDPCLIPGLGSSAGEGTGYPLQYSWASLVAQMIKHLPVVKETWVLSLGQKDPLEKEMAIHSSVLA